MKDVLNIDYIEGCDTYRAIGSTKARLNVGTRKSSNPAIISVSPLPVFNSNRENDSDRLLGA